MTEINLCSSEQEEQSAEINLCSTAQEEQDREINLCPPDVDPCAAPPELFLEGPATADAGSLYTASGGVAPYTYAITGGGEISTDGTVIRVCSTSGTVSVTDSCGQSVSLAVDMNYTAGAITDPPAYPACIPARQSQSGANGFATISGYVGRTPGNYSSTEYCYRVTGGVYVDCVGPVERVTYLYGGQWASDVCPSEELHDPFDDGCP